MRLRLATLTSCLALALATVASAALAQSDRGIAVTSKGGAQPAKLALVVGNSSYADAPLKNPVNDARDIAAALRKAGFEVIHLENVSQRDFKEAVRDFGNRLRRSETGLFYYAGHGIQSSGRNFLVPIGANITREAEIEYETVDLGFVMAQMEDAGNPLNLVILDACRNNPFARSFRSAATGLAQVSAPTGTLIAYATAPGSVASDGSGKNGLYTQELLRYMSVPGLSVEEVFKQVRIAVRQATNGQQTPWESSSLVGQFTFASTTGGAPVAAASEPAAKPAVQNATQTVALQNSMRSDAPVPAPAASSSAPAVSGPNASGPVTVGMPGVSLGTGNATGAALALPGAVDLCVAALRDRDATRLELLHTAASDQDTKNKAALIRWTKAPRAAFEHSPGSTRNVSASSPDRGSAEFSGKLRWKGSFGENRVADVALRVEVANAGGNWQVQSCRLVGAPKLP